MVGICWDKAFEGAYETIADKYALNKVAQGYHEKFFKFVSSQGDFWMIFMGIFLSAVVAGAWCLYVVPHAMKDEKQHKEDIECENNTFAKLHTPPETPSDSEMSESEDTARPGFLLENQTSVDHALVQAAHKATRNERTQQLPHN